MPDEVGNRGQKGGSHILMNDAEDVRRWCKRFKVSHGELERAVAKVGNAVAAVRKELGLTEEPRS